MIARIPHAALAAAMLWSLPAPAAASSPGLDRIYAAGRCMVAHDRGAAASLIRSLPLGRERTDLSALSPELVRRCAGSLGSPPALHLRGALAQALFFRDFRGFGLQPFRSIPLVNLELPVQDSPPGDRTTELYRLADCVVRNDPGHVERLLASRPGSDNEGRFMSLLGGYLRACPAAELSIARSDLRSALAQSAYQSMYRYWTGELRSVRN